MEAEIVPAGKGFPFLCIFCGEVDTSKDYLRMFKPGDVNGRCVHLDCIYKRVVKAHDDVEKVMKRHS